MVVRNIDKDRDARADRESRLVIDAERHAREAKTDRLRDLRLHRDAMMPPASKPVGKNPRKVGPSSDRGR